MKQTDVTTALGYASRPTPFTRRMRICVPYQLLRFTIINYKMLRMLAKAHHGSRPAPGRTGQGAR